jgi:hypothetical protein
MRQRPTDRDGDAGWKPLPRACKVALCRTIFTTATSWHDRDILAWSEHQATLLRRVAGGES